MRQNNYYPFGLKHRGYNDNQIGRDHTFEYNGIELEEALGYNMMEMDLRQFDPALAKWVVLDPVTHFEYSPYSAFDNNPIYWADPSGADSETSDYNFETGEYQSGSFEAALANQGLNADGSEKGGGCCGDDKKKKRKNIGASIVGSIKSFFSFFSFGNTEVDELASNGEVEEAMRIKKQNEKAKEGATKVLGTIVNTTSSFDVFGVYYSARLLAASQFEGDIDEFYTRLNSTLGTNHSVTGDSVGAGLSLFGAASIGGINTLSTPTFSFGSSTATAATASTMVRHGQLRLVLRGSNGQFLKGTGSILTESQYSQLYGLNALGQATYSTGFNYSRLANLPNWARWTIGISGSGAIINWGARKIIGN